MAEDTTGAIPPPLPDDDEDLVWALTTASTMWNRGDRDEAIKWVKRALEHAADNDLDDRALDLGKLVAELATKPMPSANASAKPSAAPPPPPPAAKPESKKGKSGLTGKHAAIRDAAPAAKGSAKATGKHKPLGANAAAAVLANTKNEPAAKAPAAPSVPRPSVSPKPIGSTASEPKRPTSPPPASIAAKGDDVKNATATRDVRPVSAAASEPAKATPPPAPEAAKASNDESEKSAAPKTDSPGTEARSVAPASESAPSSSGSNVAKPPSAAPRPSMAPLPTRPHATPSVSPARSVSPPSLGASPSMRPGALPALKAPPLPAITKDLVVPVPKADAPPIPTADVAAEKPAAASHMPLLQSLRVFVTADANGPRIVVARDGHTAPEGAVEAVLVATQPSGDLLALFRE